MKRLPQYRAIQRPDGLYDLALYSSNGKLLWRENQGRYASKVERDLERIKATKPTGKLVFVYQTAPPIKDAKYKPRKK